MKTKCPVCRKRVKVSDVWTLADHDACPGSGSVFALPEPLESRHRSRRREVRYGILALKRRRDYLLGRLAGTDVSAGERPYMTAEVAALALALECIDLCLTNYYLGIGVVPEEVPHG